MKTQEEILKDAHALASFFLSDPHEAAELLAPIMLFQTAQKGEIVVKQGQIIDSIYYVTKGLARQFYYKNGHDITEHFTLEGNMFYCIESLYLQRPTELMAEALEPLEYYMIPYHKLQDLALKSPHITRWLFKMYEIEGLISQQQADSLRFETSKERYENFERNYPEIAKRAPIRHIASYLAMTRESLSRVRAGKL